MSDRIWEYWQDKKGTRDAAVEQYPEALVNCAIAAAVADYDRAEAALAALMAKWINGRSLNEGLSQG